MLCLLLLLFWDEKDMLQKIRRVFGLLDYHLAKIKWLVVHLGEFIFIDSCDSIQQLGKKKARGAKHIVSFKRQKSPDDVAKSRQLVEDGCDDSCANSGVNLAWSITEESNTVNLYSKFKAD